MKKKVEKKQELDEQKLPVVKSDYKLGFAHNYAMSIAQAVLAEVKDK